MTEDTPDNIFVLMGNRQSDGKLVPHFSKFHLGRNYKYTCVDYCDVEMHEKFWKKMHLHELVNCVKNVLEGKQRVSFEEFELTEDELKTISAALKSMVEMNRYRTFPIYVQRQEMETYSSFPLELLRTHFTRVC
jgi:hypothetical protein